MQPRYPFPPAFVTINTTERGGEGVGWLRRLPQILADCEKRWAIRLGPPFPDLSYNYVAPAVRADGASIVLKAGIPNNDLQGEIEALRIYGGRGAVELLDAHFDWGVLLLERIAPGVMLSTLEDDAEATSIAASLMRELRHPPPPPPGHRFPRVEDWAEGVLNLRAFFDGGTGPFPAQLVDRAVALYNELLPSQAAPVVLHGDLHHYNILSARRRPWLAIDPHGVVGEPAYETGALMRNPLPRILSAPGLERILARRIHILSEELGFERERIHSWAVAQAVLSAWWTYEGSEGKPGGEFFRFLRFTETLAALRP